MRRLVWLALLGLAGCDDIYGNGVPATEEREVPPFDGVANHLAMEVDVRVEPGAAREVVLRCDENLLPHIVTRLVDSTLHIESEPFVTLTPRAECVTSVRTPEIASLAESSSGTVFASGELRGLARIGSSGAGGVVVDDPIVTDRLDVDSSGAGGVVMNGSVTSERIEIDSSGAGGVDAGAIEGGVLAVDVSGSGPVRAERYDGGVLDAALSGSGGLEIAAGRADQLVVHLSSSGSAKVAGIEARAADVHTSGSGSVFLTVTEAITARLSGSGDVFVAGDPSARDERASGSGRVVYH